MNCKTLGCFLLVILGFKHFLATYFVSCNSHKVVILIQQIKVLPWLNVQYYSTNKWRKWRYSSINLLQLPHFEQLRGMLRSSIASWSFHHLLPALQRFGRCWKSINRQSKWMKGTSHSSIMLLVSIMFGNGNIEIWSQPIQFNSPKKSKCWHRHVAVCVGPKVSASNTSCILNQQVAGYWWQGLP